MPSGSRRRPHVRRTSSGPSRSEQKAVELQGLLAAQSAELAGSDGYRHYRAVLVLARNHHSYSFTNWWLIYLQEPNASIVMPHHKWKAAGRDVLTRDEGGKPLYILKPINRWVTKVDETTGLETRRKVLVGFGSTHTYDISSTVGPELPVPQKLTGDAPAKLWDALTAALAERGYTVERGPTGAADGFTSPRAKKVVINPSHPPMHQLATLCHEWHHVVMGHVADDFDYVAHRGKAEMEAEGATFVALGLLGIDTSSDSVFYVTDWAEGDTDKIMQTADRVVKFGRSTAELLGLDLSEPELDESGRSLEMS